MHATGLVCRIAQYHSVREDLTTFFYIRCIRIHNFSSIYGTLSSSLNSCDGIEYTPVIRSCASMSYTFIQSDIKFVLESSDE